MGIVGGITHVDGIGSLSFARRNLRNLSTDGDARTVDIGHGVLLEHGGIVGDVVVFGGKRRSLSHRVGTDLVDGHEVSFGSVVLLGRPALEDLIRGDGARTGIVDDLLNLGSGVGLLDVHRIDGGFAANEVDGQARRLSLDDDVHGELVRIEGLTVGGCGSVFDLLGHHLVRHVENVDVVGLSTGAAEGDPDRGAIGRLDHVALSIVEGDVECNNDLRVSLLLGNSTLNLSKLLAHDGHGLEVPALGKNAVTESHGDGHAVDDEGLGVGKHGLRRLCLRLGLRSLLRLDGLLALGLGRRLLSLILGLDDGLGLALWHCRRLFCGLRLHSRLFRCRLLLGDNRLLDGCLLDDGHILVGEVVLDDDCIIRVVRECLGCLPERICHSLCREQLRHEDERESPGQRGSQLLEELAELLTHCRHLSSVDHGTGHFGHSCPMVT